MDKPLYYVRGNQYITNYYFANAHPNDKKSKAIKGQSKGRMIGLEEAGWIAIETNSKFNKWMFDKLESTGEKVCDANDI